MKQITVGFSKPKSHFAIFGKLIQFILNTEYSHTYIKFKSESLDRQLVYQATGSGVNFVSIDSFLHKNNIVVEYNFEISNDCYIKTLQFAIDRCGISYGILQIFGILYVKMLAAVRISTKNPFSNRSKTYICSELVGQILREMVHLNFNYDLDTVTPKELYDFMKENYG